MNNTASRVCTGILIVLFAAMVVGIILSALGNPDGGGTVAGAATALCGLGWYLAMKNLRRANAGDFSSEGKQSRIFQKLIGRPFATDDLENPEADKTEIPESEWL